MSDQLPHSAALPQSRIPVFDPVLLAGRYPVTPDGRYFVVRGRLWRMSNPHLDADARRQYVEKLMTARRSVAAARSAGDDDAVRAARDEVDLAKRDLGERGPVWWNDGAPDYNRHMARNTPYASWFEQVDGAPVPGGQGQE